MTSNFGPRASEDNRTRHTAETCTKGSHQLSRTTWICPPHPAKQKTSCLPVTEPVADHSKIITSENVPPEGWMCFTESSLLLASLPRLNCKADASIQKHLKLHKGFPGGSVGRESAAMWETLVRWCPGRKIPVEEEMATHSKCSCLENPMDRGA